MEYEYDGLGRSLTETVRSLLVLQSETEQLWDGMVIVAQNSSAGTTSLVRDVLGDVTLQSTLGLLGASTRWGLTDRLGSTIGQAQGSKVGQLAQYSDWGVPTFGTLGWNSETGYTGELGDTTSGLVNFYARSYDPMAGSWLQADPYRGTLNDPQSLNRHGYVTGNPTTFTDAYGYAVTGRMLHDSGGRNGTSLATSLARQEAAMVARLDPTGAKQAAAASPRAASNTTDRHVDWAAAFDAFFSGAGATMRGTVDFIAKLGFGSVYAFFDSIIRSVKSGSIQIVNPGQYWVDAFRGLGMAMQNPLNALGALVAFDKWSTDPAYALGVNFGNLLSLGIPIAGIAGKAGTSTKVGNATAEAATAAQLAAKIDASALKLSNTAASHTNRPYINSSTLMDEIMRGSTPVLDPQGVPGFVRWDTPGSFNGSAGTWQLVVDTTTNTVVHYQFKGSK